MRRRARLAAAGVLAGLILPGLPRGADAASAEPPLPIELNRLESLAEPARACRLWLVVANDSAGAAPVGALRLDLVAFDREGTIARRVAVELAPIGAGRTAVRLFDLPGLACESLSRLLINEVLACQIGGREATDCAERLRPASRAGLRFGF